ncbi:hypothetical protein [Aliiroseovarius crassostreae]|uniref:hypothetical protein n=1 Tax=Aliiroseovarius crassostreae TaxID=154981 RepID=UPI001F3508D1|nr:hypothetical protein [Aliiroseovarius crassostreae]
MADDCREGECGSVVLAMIQSMAPKLDQEGQTLPLQLCAGYLVTWAVRGERTT